MADDREVDPGTFRALSGDIRRSAGDDVQQYVVVYVELLPGSEASGERILDQLAAVAHAAGALRFDVGKEVQRSNFYVLIETWTNQAAYAAFLGSATTQA